MDESQAKQNNLLDTTDCLEAVGVFRGWKNFFFIIALLCLLVLQVSFWLVDRGCIAPCDKAKGDAPTSAFVDKRGGENTEEIKEPSVSGQAEEIKEAAEKVAAEPNKPVEETRQKTGFPFGITFEHLCWAIRIANGLLILTTALYCLSMLFSLKISLIGRLGGINHISRAFFLSLITVILLLPWQRVFGRVVMGAMYTPSELMKWCACETEGIFGAVLYYLRFTGYWLLVLLLLILSQLRNSRWTKAVLRRLEVI